MDRKSRTLGKWSPKWEGPFQIIQILSKGAYEIEELNEDKRILKVNGKYLKKIQTYALGSKDTKGVMQTS